MVDRTFVMIKPDGVRRGLVGEIISRFEKRGFKIVDIKMTSLDKERAERLYAEHKGKPFFDELVRYITSGPVVAMILEAPSAVQVVRTMIGSTDPKDASPGTIRGDMALSKSENVIHASDSPEKVKYESSVVFG